MSDTTALERFIESQVAERVAARLRAVRQERDALLRLKHEWDQLAFVEAMKLQAAEQERDSLRLELAAEQSTHRRDNEYLIGERDRVRVALERLREKCQQELRGYEAGETMVALSEVVMAMNRASAKVMRDVLASLPAKEPKP